MQISRRFILACVTVATLSPIFISAQETDAQVKAREALDQKMKELQSAPAAAESPAVTPAPTAAPVVSQPKPATTTTVASAGTPELVSPPPSDPQAIEKAREAMRQKLKEAPPVEAQPAPAAVATPAPVKKTLPPPAPVKKAAPPVAPQTTAPETVKVVPAAAAPAAAAKPVEPAGEYMAWPTQAGPDSSAQAQKALRHQMSQPATNQEIIANEKAAAAQWTATEEAKAKKGKNAPIPFETLKGPPTGLSAAKEQQLQDLLVQYRADLLTPEQYHAQRAKILGRP